MHRCSLKNSFLLAVLFSTASLPAVSNYSGFASQAFAQSRPREQPQNVFEVLFPDLYQQRLQRERALQQPAAAPITKISAPQYFTYKTDRLVVVNLADTAKNAPAKSTDGQSVNAQKPQGAELIASVSNVLEGGQTSPLTSGLADSGNGFDLLAQRFAGISVLAEPDIGKAILEHYSQSRKLLWLDADLQPTSAAQDVLKLFSEAEAFGLDPQDYFVSPPLPGTAETETLDAAARFEFTLTARALRYALDAANGRILPNRLSGYHDFPKRNLAASDAMVRLASEPTSTALAKFHPDNSAFRALVAELGRLEAQTDDSIVLPQDLLIKPGQTSEHLPLVIKAIAKRASAELIANYPALLGSTAPILPTPADQAIASAALVPASEAVTGEALPQIAAQQPATTLGIAAGAAASVAAGPSLAQSIVPSLPSLPPVAVSQLYEGEVVDMVKAFQKEAGLGADGVIGRNTLSKLAGTSLETKRQRVIIALEQLRWHPRDLGSRHVFINQPAFRARYVEGGITRIDMRVVVGTKANQTSFFHDMVETVEYNPYWGVPQSILVNEFLPKLRENPAYLDERGYEVTDNKGNLIPSSAINWYSYSSNVPFNVRQSPGEANALGELKILFPNKHAIYMHDTPARDLFKKDFRAFSHGCVRLAEPRVMAAAVLGKDVAHVESMLTKGHGQDEVPQKFPVYVAYFTAWPDDRGVVEYYPDMYGRDEAVMKAFAATRAERSAAG